MKSDKLKNMLERMSVRSLTNPANYINSFAEEKQKRKKMVQAESDLIDAYKRFRGLCPNQIAYFLYEDNAGNMKEIDDIYSLLDSFWKIC